MSEDLVFDYNGFRNAQNFRLNGTADITPGGLLRLTNNDSNHQIGHYFYSSPVQFYSNSSPAANMVIAPHRGLPGALPNQFLGLFNDSNNGKPENHVFAVELDTIKNVEYDMDNNHVGIDVNDLKSVKDESAKYYTDYNGGYKNLILKSGKIIWVEYDGSQKQVNVTIAPIEERKPSVPLSSLHLDLSTIFLNPIRRGELLLVYEFLTCGSLGKFIFPSSSSASSSLSARATLNWCQRFKIIKGVASGLVYLHEEWDVKASNVLLNAGMEPKLGDALTSRIAGTPGYIASEMNRSGLASTCTDVYAFGFFFPEVVCGKRPVQIRTDATGVRSIYLVDLVLSCWKNGTIHETADPSFGSEYVAVDIELVMKLGLLCTHTNSDFRPTMRQVVQYLNGDAALLQTDLWVLDTSDTLSQAFSRVNMGDLYPCCAGSTFSASSSTPNESMPSGPR
ncbi:hypothetical protein MKX03_001728 [Papaver bracteatum]|nr:hypothetical protein MKX03_001728 [Papaver bracteatum]